MVYGLGFTGIGTFTPGFRVSDDLVSGAFCVISRLSFTVPGSLAKLRIRQGFVKGMAPPRPFTPPGLQLG